jgi:hypothetical protein
MIVTTGERAHALHETNKVIKLSRCRRALEHAVQAREDVGYPAQTRKCYRLEEPVGDARLDDPVGAHLHETTSRITKQEQKPQSDGKSRE